MQCPALDGGHVVVGQLHHKGGGLAGKALGLLEHHGRDDDGDDAHEVEHRGNPPHVGATGKDAHDQSDDGELGGAGDHGGEHGRHATVALVLDGLGGKDARDAAAGGHDHGDEGLAGEAKATEDAIHDEGHTAHVAAVLKEAEYDKEDEDLRDEAQDRAHAADDAVDHKRHHHIGGPGAGEPAGHGVGDGVHKAVVVMLVGLGGVDSGGKVRLGDRGEDVQLLALGKHGVAVLVERGDDVALGVEVVAVGVRHGNVRGHDAGLLGGLLELGDGGLVACGLRVRVDGVLHAVGVDAGLLGRGNVAGDLVGVVGVLPRLVGLLKGGLAAAAHKEAIGEEVVVHPVRGGSAHGDKSNPVHADHDGNEDGQAKHAVGDHAVDLLGDGELARRLDHACVHDRGDPLVALGGDDGLGVVVAVLLDGLDDLLHAGKLLLGEPEGLDGG